VLRHGRIVTVLGAGRYRFWTRGNTIRRVDTRPWIVQLPTQEVPTADGFTVKVTVVGRARIIDATTFVTATQDAHAAIYLAGQVALREVLAGTTVEQLIGGRQDFGVALATAVRGLAEAGVALEQVELKDVIVPAEVRRAQAEVVIARAQGLASLERARGETAALRNLANAASLLKDNPALLQLRLIQQLAATSGHTVVIGQAPLGA
jgi:regulator of protease activity HflC (stomatin/prohibitin superfamily)